MTDKQKNLEQAIAQIEKEFGKGSIMRLGDYQNQDIEVIPTGCLTLDFALGVGGVPRGRIVEIYGPESSGKTTVSLHIVAEAQRLGGTAAFIDAAPTGSPMYTSPLPMTCPCPTGSTTMPWPTPSSATGWHGWHWNANTARHTSAKPRTSPPPCCRRKPAS